MTNRQFHMRRFFTLALAMVTLASAAWAQPNKVLSAMNYLKYNDLQKAKDAIDQASAHEKTAAAAKTHYYKGKVYLAIAQSDDPAFDDVKESASTTAAEAFRYALDASDNKRLDLNEIKVLYSNTIPIIFQNGVDKYNMKSYGPASEYFERAAQITAYFDKVDTLAYYNAGLSAELAENYPRAIGLYTQVKEMGYNGARMYLDLMRVYKLAGQDDEAFNILKEGREKYPDDQALLTEETNYYLKSPEKLDEALANLNQAIEKDPKNASFYFARGTLQDKKGDPDAAAADYKMASELDPEMSDAFYNLGAIYVNQSGVVQEEMNGLDFSEQKKYDELKAKRDGLFAEAVAPLERAHQLDPENKVVMQTLMKLYSALGKSEQYQEMRSKLGQ